MKDIYIKSKRVVVDPMSINPTEPFIAPRKKSSSKKVILWIVGLLLLLSALAAAGYFYTKYQDVKDNPKDSVTQKNQAETDRVLSSLKENLLITETEAPTVARVEEPDKLKQSNAEFYKDIIKGDYLVIFPKRAIIYRETNKQIINIAPIVDTSELKSDTPATSTPAANTENNSQTETNLEP